jgi:phosphoserine aminotransferase
VLNFSAGPAVLPPPVVEQVQAELLRMPRPGMSMLEVSHRSTGFQALLEETLADLRTVGRIPADYQVLLLHGGASLQFSMVPQNLLGPGGRGCYVETGFWSTKAIEDAGRVGTVVVTGSTKDQHFRTVPSARSLLWSRAANYGHVTSNNTIEGTRWPELPDAPFPLVVDASSDIMSGPMDFRNCGLIYASAQKNLGPAGVTVVIIRDDILERCRTDMPAMLSYRVHAEHRSCYNTPNTFGIYVLGLVVKWMRSVGGLEQIRRMNVRKALRLYEALDASDFYRPTAAPECRSLMNVTFRLANQGREPAFLAAAERAGMDGLAGHRSVGGVRASIYNAFPEAGVSQLVEFLREFERTQS